MTDESTKLTTHGPRRVLDEKTLESIKRHIGGATVRHASPFKDLPVPVRRGELTREFSDHWVVPLYVTIHGPDSDPILQARWHEMNRDVAYDLLADFNWRARRVGAYIIALRQLHELTEDVGRLLLRSDVCFAGHDYCLALARFNTPRSRQYLNEYLDYYLDRLDLRFNQDSALGAVAYLDQINGTHYFDSFLPRWRSFAANKPYLDLEQSRSNLSSAMERIQTLTARLSQA